MTSGPAESGLMPALLAAPAADLVGSDPDTVRRWIDGATAATLPAADGTLETTRAIAGAAALHALADNTRRAYRAGVKAWCEFCAAHALPVLPARPDDVAAFVADQREPAAGRKPLALATLSLRLAALAYLHHAAGVASPTDAGAVKAALRGFRRLAVAGRQRPQRKRAIGVDLLGQLVAPLGDGLADRRDKAILLVGFAGAFRRAELAGLRIEDLEAVPQGYRITLPASKGDRELAGVTVALKTGRTDLCPVRALDAWRAAALIGSGPLFRRVRAGIGALVIGTEALDPGSIARIVKARIHAAGLDPTDFAGHSLKRGALNAAQDARVHPAALKRLGRHKSYAPLASYLDDGDLFDEHALDGLL